ncbi:MAG: PQQ-dependent sugar dehydrogenase [Litorivicinaceae bacterium]
MRHFIISVCLGAVLQTSALAVTSTVESRVTGLNSPWAVAWIDARTVLITERPGRLLEIDLTTGARREVAGLPAVAAAGQGGLLDVAVDPKFSDNRWIYLSLSAGQGGLIGTELWRARLENGQLNEVTQLFAVTPKTSGGRHFGSRIVFERDDVLWLTLGDRGDQDQAQNLDTHIGSVVRLHTDGRIPDDNPYLKTPGARPELFSIGHRNIQGAFRHPETGALWTHEHGPQGGDELNLTEAGKNYGWPIITYGRNYGLGTPIGEGTEKPGMEQPKITWVPSIAPSGMTYYTGTRLPDWTGSVFLGALRGQHLVRLEIDQRQRVTKTERLFENELGRIRDVRTSPDGGLYLLTDGPNGQLFEVVPGT